MFCRQEIFNKVLRNEQRCAVTFTFSDDVISLFLELATTIKQLIHRQYNTVYSGHCTKDFRNENVTKYKFHTHYTDANNGCQLNVPNYLQRIPGTRRVTHIPGPQLAVVNQSFNSTCYCPNSFVIKLLIQAYTPCKRDYCHAVKCP